MVNENVLIVINELEKAVGDILAKGMTTKGLQKIGANPETATAADVWKALNVHIKPSLSSFMSSDKSKELLWKIRKQISAGA